MVSKQDHFVRKWGCDEALYRKTPGHDYRLRLAVALPFILATVNRQFRYINAIFSGKRLAFNVRQATAKLSYPGGERKGREHDGQRQGLSRTMLALGTKCDSPTCLSERRIADVTSRDSHTPLMRDSRIPPGTGKCAIDSIALDSRGQIHDFAR